MNKAISILLSTLAFGLIGCHSKTDHCQLPEMNQALKEALVLDMKDWQQNAKHQKIMQFEEKVWQLVEQLEIAEVRYAGKMKALPVIKNENPDEYNASSCRCSAKIRFKDHQNYKQRIAAPVAKVKAEEHPLNSAYLRLENQMNYLENNGFVFSFVAVKKEDSPVRVLRYYPFPKETAIDEAGGLLYEFIEAMEIE